MIPAPGILCSPSLAFCNPGSICIWMHHNSSPVQTPAPNQLLHLGPRAEDGARGHPVPPSRGIAPTQDRTHTKEAGESLLGTRGHFQTAPGAPSSLLLTNNIHLTGHSARNCLHPSNSQSLGSAPACQEPGMEQHCASEAGTIPTALPGSIH